MWSILEQLTTVCIFFVHAVSCRPRCSQNCQAAPLRKPSSDEEDETELAEEPEELVFGGKDRTYLGVFSFKPAPT